MGLFKGWRHHKVQASNTSANQLTGAIPQTTPLDQGLESAHAAGSQKSDEGNDQIFVSEFQSLSSTLTAEMSYIQQLSESEVTEAGADLNRIVENIKGLVDDEKLTVKNTLDAHKKTLNEFLTTASNIIDKQNHTVEEVRSSIEEIKGSLDSIKNLNQSANLLALNAKIESARLGDQGRAFGIISDQMRELSFTIEKVTEQVESASNNIVVSLPEVVERAEELQKNTTNLISNENQNVMETRFSDTSTIGEGNTRMDKIMRLLNSALGHLQFQDLMSQKLSGMKTKIETLLDRHELKPDNDEEKTGADNLESGDFISFEDEGGVKNGNFIEFD